MPTRLIKELEEKTAEEQYDFIKWLILDYGMQFTDSKEAVIEWLKGEKMGDEHWCVNPIIPIFDYIKSMPTADEAKVVRCKDCKYHEDEVPGMVWCPHIVGNWVDNNWFCADGKQKRKKGGAE